MMLLGLALLFLSCVILAVVKETWEDGNLALTGMFSLLLLGTLYPTIMILVPVAIASVNVILIVIGLILLFIACTWLC